MSSKRSPYVVIYLDARRRLELSLAEYALVEIIDRLSGSRSPHPGWCVASRKYLASSLGITERSVYTKLDRLVALGLLQRNETRAHLLRPTDVWKRHVEPFRVSEASLKDRQATPEESADDI